MSRPHSPAQNHTILETEGVHAGVVAAVYTRGVPVPRHRPWLLEAMNRLHDEGAPKGLTWTWNSSEATEASKCKEL